VDGTVAIAPPAMPEMLEPQGRTETTTPTLSWTSSDFRSNALSYEVRLSSTGAGGHLILSATTLIPSLRVPVGVLAVDRFYAFEVRAHSPAGRSGSAQSELSVVGP
jgi:hypothetical protein